MSWCPLSLSTASGEPRLERELSKPWDAEVKQKFQECNDMATDYSSDARDSGCYCAMPRVNGKPNGTLHRVPLEKKSESVSPMLSSTDEGGSFQDIPSGGLMPRFPPDLRKAIDTWNQTRHDLVGTRLMARRTRKRLAYCYRDVADVDVKLRVMLQELVINLDPQIRELSALFEIREGAWDNYILVEEACEIEEDRVERGEVDLDAVEGRLSALLGQFDIGRHDSEITGEPLQKLDDVVNRRA